MQFFNRVFLLIVVCSVVFFLYLQEEELGFPKNDSGEESNLTVVLSDAMVHNNIYALNDLIQKSEVNENFYTEIKMSEASFLAFKNQVCQANIAVIALKFEYEKKYIETICGVKL